MRTAILTLAAMAMLATSAAADTADRHQDARHCFTPIVGQKSAMTLNAATPFGKTDSQKNQFREETRGTTTMYIADIVPESEIRREPEAPTVEFTVKLDFDDSRFVWNDHDVMVLFGHNLEYVNFNRIYNPETGRYEQAIEAKGELPEGTYDFMTRFYDFVDKEDVLMVHENVAVAEGTEVVFRPAEAQNRVTFEPLFPSGDKVKLPMVEKDDDGNWQRVEDGNVDLLNTYWQFNSVEHLGGSDMYYTTDSRLADEPETYSVTFRFNDVSDNYTANLVAVATVHTENGVKEYLSNINPEHLQTGVYQTDIQNYTDIRWNGAKGDFAQIDVLGEDVSMFEIVTYSGGLEGGGFSHGWVGLDYEELLFAPSKNNSSDGRMVGFRPYIHEFIMDNSDDPESYHDYALKGCWGQPIFCENGEWCARSVRCNDFASYFWTEEAYGDFEIQRFPTHERFDYTAANTDIVLGNTVPVINNLPLLWHTDWENPENLTYAMGNLYCGRLGEVSDGCILTTEYSVKYNGEVAGEGDNFTQFLGPWWYGGKHEPGIYDYELTQNHILVDGKPASVKANVHIDQTSGDTEAPTLQHLMTRNADDFITDRFATPEGAFIELCGGDFRPYEFELYKMVYAYEKAADVKAEWAVKDSGEWHELEVAEVPDGYRLGWGDLYRVKLDDINLPSDSKWYDLRVTLVDNAGNYQQQVLSPAFSIENVSGVGAVKDEAAKIYGVDGAIVVNGADRAEVYTLDGRKVAETGASRIVVAPGIYIVRTSGRTVKVSVK